MQLSVPLHKTGNGIPLNTIEHHSVSFSTIGSFSDISVGLGGTVNGHLKYQSIPLNDTKNPKYHSNSDTVYHSNTLGHNMPYGI